MCNDVKTGIDPLCEVFDALILWIPFSRRQLTSISRYPSISIFINLEIGAITSSNQHRLCDWSIRLEKEITQSSPLLDSMFNIICWHIWFTNSFTMPTKHCLHQFGCLKWILALFAYIRAIPVEQERKWNTEKNEECWNGARPLIPKVVVHLGGEQRECSAK